MSEPPVPGEFGPVVRPVDWRAIAANIVAAAEADWGLLTLGIVGAVVGVGSLAMLATALYVMAHAG